MKKKKAGRQKAATETHKPVKPVPVPVKSYTRELLVIAILTILAYIPALRAGIVTWDDPDYVNAAFFRSGFSNFFTTPIQGNYHPLTMISLAINYSISGMDAWSYHLLNLLLHLFNCWLVFRFVMLLSNRNLVIAFTTALLFGIHPMHVESVAWISERKDVLYAVFFISGLISYTKYVDSGNRKQYLLAILFLILALASKPAAVIFPVVLFTIDLIRRRKFGWKLLMEKLPFFVLPLIMGIITFVAQKEKGAVDTEAFAMSTRILMGFYGIMMYIFKLFFPFNLSPFYPFPAINMKLPAEYYAGPVFFILLAVLCWYSWKRDRVITFGILFYLTNLLLVLQFLPVGSAVIADRYTYIPYIGLFYILGWLINRFAKGNIGRANTIILPVAIIFTILAFRQASIWISSETLWDHAIAVTPTSRAYDNRARLYSEEKNYAKALELFNEALKLNAIDNEGYSNRGNVYFNTNRLDLAYQDYKKALSIKPDYYPALDNIGALYAMRGQYDSALINLTHALAVKPDYISALRNRALTYLEIKKYDEAIKDFENFLKYSPDDPDIYNAIGVCYRLNGKYPEALTAINKALSIKQDPHFYLNRSYAYNSMKNLDLARKDAMTAKQNGLQLDAVYAKELGIQ